MIFSVWWICFRCWSLIFFLPEMISSWLLSESWSRHHTDSSTFQQIKAVHCVSRHTSFLKMTNWKAWIKIYSLQETFFYLSPTGKMGEGGVTIFFIAIVQTSFMMICKTDFIFKYLCHEYFYFNHLILA